MTEPHAHDPTADIGTPTQALLLAEWLLKRASLPGTNGQDEEISGIWRTVAAVPLAAILYTVSPVCAAGGGGLPRALRVASKPDHDGGHDNWISTADLCAHTYLADRLRTAATLTGRQRNCMRDIILDALDVLADTSREHIPCLHS